MKRTQHVVATSILALAAFGTAVSAQPAPEPLAPPADPVIILDTDHPVRPLAASAAPRASYRVSSHFLIPHFETTIGDPDGTTTLVAVRNEDDPSNIVQVDVFSEPGTLLLQEFLNLGPKEVWTVNLRDLLDPLFSDGTVVTGYVELVGTNLMTTDSFQIDTANDFAVGGSGFRSNDLCDDHRLRFLSGGAFSGGTTVEYYVAEPLGGNPDTDPPTITGTFFDEAGGFLNNFSIYTTLSSDAFDISALRSSTEPFGSVDWRFQNPSGGLVLVTHDALGRFSVRVPGICLDSL